MGVILRVVMSMIVIMVVVLVLLLLRIRTLQRPAIREDTETGPGKSSTRGLAALDRDPRKPEAGHHVGEQLERQPQVQAGSQKHVPRDAAAAVQVVDHHL